MTPKKLSFTQKRRIARENALKVLYAIDLSGDKPEYAIDNYFDLFSETPEDPDIREYTRSLVTGVLKNKERIDRLVEEYSENWSLDRMAIIDRNILRYAVYEIFYVEDVPPLVSINEAIEIGKIYGNMDSRRFINGILDKISKSLKEMKK